MSEPAPLAGARILITRPVRQAEPLARAIRELGGAAVVLPLIEILPPADPVRLDETFGRLEQYTLAIFISPNAVDQAFARLAATQRPWPASLRIAAVGAGTAQALADHGHPASIVPRERFDSEGLLADPALRPVHGQRILIVRGEGGRELLADTLRARGAEVDYAECYRRAPPAADAGAARLLRDGAVDIVVITSGEAIDNLLALYGDTARQFLRRTRSLVVSERLSERVKSLQPQAEPLVARAGDADLLAALRAWRAGQNTL